MTVASVCSSSGSEMGRLAREREIERAVEGQERDRESCRER